ncbi:uncharacterized protein LOC117785141 [Drosophila innubila]|uniref:uncharacterized protein LOC117785141 n=1 Tax=Drosophila innubila TaxID=198719 RepID=UPI00148CCAE2|nr:uncharacterized protein LOC117785141 [Drosophila innubila]
MASIVGHVPVFPAGETIPDWAKIGWNSKVQHDIYRDWGTYYAHRRRLNFAQYYYTKSLEFDENDYLTLYRRSMTKRKAAEIKGSLEDARVAAAMGQKKRGPNCPINLQICDNLFELNQFENCNCELRDNLRRFIGVKARNFELRRKVVDDVIKDVTGKGLSLFYLNFQKVVEQVSAILKANEMQDKRPMWKILKEQEKCDVLSIPEVEEENPSPLEIARRKRAFNVIHQNYLNLSWHDVLFMKTIRKNPNLLLEQCTNSKNFLANLSQSQYDIVRRFIKMIHSRNPLYYVSFLKFSNKKMLEKNKEAYLFGIQYQTHRNMIADLRQIRRLRKEKRLKSLAEYVEKVMGDYYVTKTNRVMCWKFEFINEVYNTLALALTEQYYVPKFFKQFSTHSALLSLLRQPANKIKDAVPFVFGDRSTYQDGDAKDPVAIKARQLISRLEKRIKFAKFSIEKCYLYHQISSVHLSQLHYDECTLNARRAIKECRNCNSVIWHFLSLLLIIKANVLQHKVEASKESVEEAYPIARQLKFRPLNKFMELCLQCVEDDLRKKGESIASQRTSKASGTSLI